MLTEDRFIDEFQVVWERMGNKDFWKRSDSVEGLRKGVGWLFLNVPEKHANAAYVLLREFEIREAYTMKLRSECARKMSTKAQQSGKE